MTDQDIVEFEYRKTQKEQTKFLGRFFVFGTAAETLFTIAVIVFGFLFWQFVDEKAVAGQQQTEALVLLGNWAEQEQIPSEDDVSKEEPKIQLGDNIAILQIPSFGEDWIRVIASGVGNDVLNNPKTGIGHYPSSSPLGQKGNFALAGHRQGNGSPFRNLDKLNNGDEILITRGNLTYVYWVEESFVVSPYETWVLDDIPGRDTISLITCHPLVTFENRLVVRGDLIEVRTAELAKLENESSEIGAIR